MSDFIDGCLCSNCYAETVARAELRQMEEDLRIDVVNPPSHGDRIPWSTVLQRAQAMGMFKEKERTDAPEPHVAGGATEINFLPEQFKPICANEIAEREKEKQMILGEQYGKPAFQQVAEELDRQEASRGSKLDSGKAPMELLDAEALEEMARVMEFGAKKYAANNWRKGLASTRLLGAILRHTLAYLGGETNDPETGKSHMAHVMCEAQFEIWTHKHKPHLDDRFIDGE